VKGASETGKWDGLIAEFIDASVMLPAVGQAAIGLEIRGDDEHTRSLLESVNHFGTFVAVRAERAFLLALGGGCHTPIAALGTFDTAKKIVRLEGAVFSLDGKKQLRGELSGAADDPESLGKKLAEELIAQGAAELLK
jgi:hydroxymethylbilane synthase